MEINEINVDTYGWFFKYIFTSNQERLKSISKEIHGQVDRLKIMVANALKPFMAVIKLKPSLFSYKEIALDLEKALAPAVDFLESIPISAILRRQPGFAETDRTEEIKYIVVMTRAGWPPLFDIPIDFIRQINKEYQVLDKASFRSHITKRVMDLYDKKGIDQILKKWSQKKELKDRFPLLKGALSAHNRKKYDLSLPVFIAQIESLVVKINKHTDKLKPEQFNLYIDLLFSKKNNFLPLKGLIIDAIYKNFKWGDKALPPLSRYTILHGTGINGGQSEHSLKLILILDMVIHLL